MNIVYVDSDRPSVFLAGPTPRDKSIPSWRPQAIEIFQELGFKGSLYVPERSDGSAKFEYYDQVEWEWNHLHNATVVMFWVPRELKYMPAMTTNVEFGLYLAKRPDRVVYGRPDWAAKNKYLDWLYEKMTGNLPDNDLRTTVVTAMTRVSCF